MHGYVAIWGVLVLVLPLVTSVSAAGACGIANAACCDDSGPGYCEDSSAACVNKKCIVQTPGKGLCEGKGTKAGEECCLGSCAGRELECAEDAMCVNLSEEDAVTDESLVPLGFLGGPCIPGDLCDNDQAGNLECIASKCVAAAEIESQADTANCGKKGKPCCYDSEGPLCATGSCKPPDPLAAEEDPVTKAPCLCASGECVENIDYCRTGTVCDQSSDPEPCGALGEPCCPGPECNDYDSDTDSNELICHDESNTCIPRPQPVKDQSFGCGKPGEKCCGASSSCDDDTLTCSHGLCRPKDTCSLPGDTCCQGHTCNASPETPIICDTTPDSLHNGLCVMCGGANQPCCANEHCGGTHLRCSAGVCTAVPGSCDQVGKGCCEQDSTGAAYCQPASDGSGRLGCNTTPEQEEFDELCEDCGGSGQVCCMPEGVDASTASKLDLATGPPTCTDPGHSCMLDDGNADYFSRCRTCGQEIGDPCCWLANHEKDSTSADTEHDKLVPVCPGVGVTCQEVVTLDEAGLGEPKNFYRCVAEDTLIKGKAVEDEGYCGGFGQRCCSSGDPRTQCGFGLACNVDKLECEECGRADLPCCPSLDANMPDYVCAAGLGCTNDVSEVYKRTCKACGGWNTPCCWSEATGYHCNEGLRCSGVVGVDQMCT